MAGDAKKAMENMQGSLLETVRIENAKESLLILKQDLKVLDSISSDDEAPVRLLPRFDSYVLGHRDRTRIIDNERKKSVFRKAGNIAATLIIDGRITGIWTHKRTKSNLTLTIAPFRRLTKNESEQVEKEAKGLSLYMSVAELKLSIAR